MSPRSFWKSPLKQMSTAVNLDPTASQEPNGEGKQISNAGCDLKAPDTVNLSGFQLPRVGQNGGDAQPARPAHIWTAGELSKMIEELGVNVRRLLELIEGAKNQPCLACTRQQAENAIDIEHVQETLKEQPTLVRTHPQFLTALDELKRKNVVPDHILVQKRQGE